VRAVTVQAALVDVADEEVGAALVAAVADLAQQVLDRDAGFFGPALAEVVAVGVDEGGPVLRDALQPFRLAAGSSRAEALPANSRATVLTCAVSRETRRW